MGNTGSDAGGDLLTLERTLGIENHTKGQPPGENLCDHQFCAYRGHISSFHRRCCWVQCGAVETHGQYIALSSYVTGQFYRRRKRRKALGIRIRDGERLLSLDRLGQDQNRPHRHEHLSETGIHLHLLYWPPQEAPPRMQFIPFIPVSPVRILFPSGLLRGRCGMVPSIEG